MVVFLYLRGNNDKTFVPNVRSLLIKKVATVETNKIVKSVNQINQKNEQLDYLTNNHIHTI